MSLAEGSAVCMGGGIRGVGSTVTREVGYPRALASMAIHATRVLRPWCWAQHRLLVPLGVLASLMLCATTVGARVT